MAPPADIKAAVRARLELLLAIGEVIKRHYVVTKDRSVRARAGEVAAIIAADFGTENSPAFRRALRQSIALLGGLPPRTVHGTIHVFPGVKNKDVE